MNRVILFCLVTFSFMIAEAHASRSWSSQETVCMSAEGQAPFKFVGRRDIAHPANIGRQITYENATVLTVKSVNVLAEKIDSRPCDTMGPRARGSMTIDKTFDAELDVVGFGEVAVRCQYKMYGQSACDEG